MVSVVDELIEYYYPKLETFRESARVYKSTKRSKGFTLDIGSVVYNPMEMTQVYNSDTYRKYDRKFRKHVVDKNIVRISRDSDAYVVIKPICSRSITMLAAFISGEHVDGWDFFEGLDKNWRRKNRY